MDEAGADIRRDRDDAHGGSRPPLRTGGVRGAEGIPGGGRENPRLPHRRERETAARVGRLPEDGHAAVELFTDMVRQVVRANERFVPPYGTGASLYIRPVLFGTGPQVGVKPASEYLLIVFVTPVGPYYKEGFNPIRVIIDRDHDRAAPLGTDTSRPEANYGASLTSAEIGHEKGYPSVLYLNAKEKKHIDECGAANFFAIRDGRYITPKSHSVLPSITNMSLMTLAAEMGLQVEQRVVDYDELGTFDEAGSCGTAAVISPIREHLRSRERTHVRLQRRQAGSLVRETLPQTARDPVRRGTGHPRLDDRIVTVGRRKRDRFAGNVHAGRAICSVWPDRCLTSVFIL